MRGSLVGGRLLAPFFAPAFFHEDHDHDHHDENDDVGDIDDNVEYEDDGEYHHNDCVLYDVFVNEEYDLNKNICVVLLCDVQVCLHRNLY